MNTERINWIDSLKFIGMFYIYLGHLGQGAGKLYFFVFSFHVPLFFFISGLLFKGPKATKEIYFIAQKTFRSIIIPFFIFSLIGVAFLTIKNQSTAESVREMLWQSALGVRNNIPLGSLWFLPCLFVVILYHSLLEVVIKNKVIVFLVALLFYIFTPSWWDGVPRLVFNLDSALYYLVFFSFGYMISDKLKNEWITPTNKHRKLLNYIILAMALFLMSAVYYKTMYLLLDGFTISPLQYIVSFSITVSLFIPSIALAKCIQLPSILHLGKNSILLCGTEQIIKLSTFSILSVLGLSYRIVDPIDAVIYTCLCFALSYFTTLKIYTHIKGR